MCCQIVAIEAVYKFSIVEFEQVSFFIYLETWFPAHGWTNLGTNSTVGQLNPKQNPLWSCGLAQHMNCLHLEDSNLTP